MNTTIKITLFSNSLKAESTFWNVPYTHLSITCLVNKIAQGTPEDYASIGQFSFFFTSLLYVQIRVLELCFELFYISCAFIVL